MAWTGRRVDGDIRMENEVLGIALLFLCLLCATLFSAIEPHRPVAQEQGYWLPRR